MSNQTKRWVFALWVAVILGFAVLHALNLRADFPNHSPWSNDWAKYTDEGWYGNAAIRAHLFGNWYLAGDFNPAVALPMWPFLEWLLFFATGVTVQAARGLAVAFFFVNLLLSYWLVRARAPRWVGLLALTLLVTSPFLYCFSRLAILEPSLTALMLAALNLAVRLPQMRRKAWAAAGIGLLFTLMMLTKTTAIFLLPALAWAVALSLWANRKDLVRCLAAAGATAAGTYGLWMALVVKARLMVDYHHLFFINAYPKPPEVYWPLASLWWSFHGGLWVDHILVPLAGLIVVGALAGWRREWARELLCDPLVGAAVLAVAGYILFMTVQNHPQPRYFAVVAVFCFLLVAKGADALLAQAGRVRELGWAVLALAGIAAVGNGVWTVSYALHPEYTFVAAAQELTQYIDAHPNGKRLLVSISGDEITLVTHLPSLCDDFGTVELPVKMARYQPGWYAAWNDLDPGTLADIHTHFSLEQVASFDAYDDPERRTLILFKLHPLPRGEVREQGEQNTQVELPGDKFDAPIE